LRWHHDDANCRQRRDGEGRGVTYGLEWDDLAWILRECDYPVETLRDKAFSQALEPKGFWRVDKEKDPELRHTVLSLAAFRELKGEISKSGGDTAQGIETFCKQNGDGWMLPETLCLAALGLGHDERAGEPQPVRGRLGARFLPWQLQQSRDDVWSLWEQHAETLQGAGGYQVSAEPSGGATSGLRDPLGKVPPHRPQCGPQPLAQAPLFPSDEDS
jgi:hypothetical protein